MKKYVLIALCCLMGTISAMAQNGLAADGWASRCFGAVSFGGSGRRSSPQNLFGRFLRNFGGDLRHFCLRKP